MKKIHVIPIDQHFLRTFTDYYFKENKPDLSSYAVIFPNRRSFLYLNKILASRLKTPSFPPAQFTISEFIEYIFRKKYPEYRTINFLDSVWLLFKIIKDLKIKFPEIQKGTFTFSTFFPWGTKILKFINLIDIENIENKALINLKENAKLDFDIPDIINVMFQNLIAIRNEFHNHLEKNKMFTKGFLYLKAVEVLPSLDLAEFRQIYFAGLFALTGIEKIIIKFLMDKDKAELIVNGDPNNWPAVLKPLMNYFNREWDIISSPKKTHNPVHIHSTFDSHSMAMAVYNTLNQKHIIDTVIVLPSADTLFPLLNFVIENLQKNKKINNFNISLGFPLNRTSSLSRRIPVTKELELVIPPYSMLT